jgi:protein-disulfide isomerase
MKNTANGFLAIVMVAGLIVGGLILSSPKTGTAPASTSAPEATATEVKPELLYNDDAPTIGSKDAKVKVVIFSDYLCPYCKQTSEDMAKIMQENQGKVELIHRNLIVHPPQAEILARAAEAANLQGKFAEMDNALFEKSPETTEEAMVNLAKELKLDENKFKNDLGSDRVKKRISQDDSDATALGLRGTPSIFINGKPLDDPRELADAINKELSK